MKGLAWTLVNIYFQSYLRVINVNFTWNAVITFKLKPILKSLPLIRYVKNDIDLSYITSRIMGRYIPENLHPVSRKIFFSQNLSLHFVLSNLLFIVCVFAVMSFPADGIESTYKNNIDDVRDFLDAKYPDNYLIINVSPRTYRTEKLGDRVCLIWLKTVDLVAKLKGRWSWYCYIYILFNLFFLVILQKMYPTYLFFMLLPFAIYNYHYVKF